VESLSSCVGIEAPLPFWPNLLNLYANYNILCQ
jgi:hypothetical protein